MNQAALFIDLDGTIIETKSGRKFPVDSDDWKFKRHIWDALKYTLDVHKNIGYIIIVSNQAGIEAGYVKEEDFKSKLQKIKKRIESKYPYLFVLSYYTTSKKSPMRKPNPGIAHACANKYQIDLASSVMIGDAGGEEGDFSDSDLQFAINSGIKTFYHIDKLINEVCS